MNRQRRMRAWHPRERKMYEVVGLTWDRANGELNTVSVLGQVPVRPHESYILMDWVGMPDKHGKDIFEHDILAHRYAAGKTLYEAVIGEQTHYIDGLNYPYYGVHFLNLSRHNEPYSGMDYPGMSDLEIVGNRYANPELIENEE